MEEIERKEGGYIGRDAKSVPFNVPSKLTEQTHSFRSLNRSPDKCVEKQHSSIIDDRSSNRNLLKKEAVDRMKTYFLNASVPLTKTIELLPDGTINKDPYPNVYAVTKGQSSYKKANSLGRYFSSV